MTLKVSAGLLMYRFGSNGLEVLLAHPGGPYYEGKDFGYWGIPKGQVENQETFFEAAVREFNEETGIRPGGYFIFLGRIIENSGKNVFAWAFEGNWNTAQLSSNLFEMEWPPYSGTRQFFPEIDKIEFFTPEIARRKIHQSQNNFIDRLEDYLSLIARKSS